MPQPTQKRGAKKVSSPEQRLEKIRSDRAKNHADQNTLQQRLSELKRADAALEQEESRCVMEIISRNAAQRYGENYTTAQLLEYLSSVEPTEEPCAGLARSEQGPEEHREVLGALLPNEVNEGEDEGDSSDVKPLFD